MAAERCGIANRPTYTEAPNASLRALVDLNKRCSQTHLASEGRIMNSRDFVEALKRHVGDAAIEGTIAIKHVPGRGARPKERARSDWYNGLSATEADHVNDAIATAVHATLFGLLVVLDGDRLIDDKRGQFELAYVTDQRVLLNDPEEIGLHDLLNASD
jgi:hypothetical protein